MSPTQEAAMKMALEALEQSETTVPYDGFGKAHREAERKHQAAIAALRVALAERQEPVVDAAIHAAWTAGFVEGEKAALAEPVVNEQLKTDPVQEPDPWGAGYEAGYAAGCQEHAQPQLQPLSEDEIFKIENDIPDDVVSDRAWTIWFARAVEKAHGIS